MADEPKTQRVEFAVKKPAAPQIFKQDNSLEQGVGFPFVFCGRIVEAYYTNPELDTVEILWSDGEVNRSYHLKVDENDDQFKALLKEWSYESLDECTRKKHEEHRQKFRDAFHNYAERHNLYGMGKSEEEQQGNLDLMFEFDPEDTQDKEALFKLKLKIFDQDVVKKSRKKKAKTDIRKAETPIEAIVAYHSFLK